MDIFSSGSVRRCMTRRLSIRILLSSVVEKISSENCPIGCIVLSVAGVDGDRELVIGISRGCGRHSGGTGSERKRANYYLRGEADGMGYQQHSLVAGATQSNMAHKNSVIETAVLFVLVVHETP